MRPGLDDHPVTDVRGLSPQQLRDLSFHDPSRAPRPPAGTQGPSPDVQALLAYAGPEMTDPTLAARLKDLDLPVHVIWGESDGIVDTDYGKAFAARYPRRSSPAASTSPPADRAIGANDLRRWRAFTRTPRRPLTDPWLTPD